MDDISFSDFLENDEFETDESEWMPAARDGVVFMIDCTPTMVSELAASQVRDGANTGLKLALLCCRNFMQSKALSSPDDLVGIVFMRVNASTPSEFAAVTTVQNLDLTGAPRILEVESLLELPSDKIVERYGSLATGDSYPVHEALWACQNIFSRTKKPLGYKRIFLITDDPNPIGNKPQLKRQAILKANDLRHSGIELEVTPIQQEGIEFKMDVFYQNLVPVDEDGLTAQIESGDHLDKLLTLEKSQEPSSRRLSRLPFYLVPITPAAAMRPDAASSALAFGTSSYCLVRKAPPPKQVRIYAKTNEPVSMKRRFYKVGSKNEAPKPENLLMPHDIQRALRIGSRTVIFEKNEITGRSKQILAVGIHLLGFKPLTTLKAWCQVKTSQFLYPDEGMAKGSSVWFTTLLSVCLRKRVYAMAMCVQRQGLPPSLVALVPQAEELDDSGAQTASPGFHMLFLPFREDFRRLSLSKHSLAKPEEVSAAKEMIKKMTSSYSPDAIPNPTLQRHYAELEALALERTKAPEVVDFTQPDAEYIEKHAGKEMKKFAEAVSLQSCSPQSTPTRKVASGSGAPLTEAELRDHFTAGTLAKLTVPILKQAVTLLRIKAASNRKADLLAAITKYFDR